MIIDHKERTILITEDELVIKERGFIVENLDQGKTVFYMSVDYSEKTIKQGQSVYSSKLSGDEFDEEEIQELTITLKSMTPAYNYLSRFDIHDYKVILNKDKKVDNS